MTVVVELSKGKGTAYFAGRGRTPSGGLGCAAAPGGAKATLRTVEASAGPAVAMPIRLLPRCSRSNDVQ